MISLPIVLVMWLCFSIGLVCGFVLAAILGANHG